VKRFVSVLLFLGVLLLPRLTYAQVIPASWTMKIYDAGTQTVRGTNAIPLASAQCNQAAPVIVPGGNVNPTDLWWDDVAVAGRKCHYVSKPTDPLIVLPNSAGSFEATLTACSATNQCANESARTPFTKPGTAPAVVTGFILQ
jgi:hypothetical protein